MKYEINRLGVSGVMSKQCMERKGLFQTLDTTSQEPRKNMWKLKKENQHKSLSKFQQKGMRINKESYRPKNAWEFSRRIKPPKKTPESLKTRPTVHPGSRRLQDIKLQNSINKAILETIGGHTTARQVAEESCPVMQLNLAKIVTGVLRISPLMF